MNRHTCRSSVRVVQVSSAHPAGDPRIFEKQCTTLAQAGYDVRLIATGEASPAASFPVITFRRSDRRLVRMSVGVARAVLRAITMRPTIVHLHDPELIPAVPLLRLFGIKVVFDSHEHIAASMTNKAYLPTALRRTARRASRWLVSLADRRASAIVTATPAIAADFRNERTVVIQNFPILAQWAESDEAKRSPNRLVFIGGISEGRGIFQMLEAIEQLGDSHGARLTLAGTVSADLLSRMQSHPGWRHTEFVGSLDRPELAQLLAESTIGLVLFLPEPNHIASQPTKMFEYMAAGLPVLVSDYPLWRALVLQAGVGIVVDPLNVAAIVDAATALLDHPADRVEMGQQGRRLIEGTRNWRVESEHLVRLYDDLSGATGSPTSA